MITDKTFIPAIFSLVKKAFNYDDGALVIISLPWAVYFKKILKLQTPESPALEKLFEILSIGVDPKDFLLPILAFGIATSVYVTATIMDFITGLRASKKEHLISSGSHRGYIKSDKLWSSVWKFFGVILIGSILTVFDLLFVISGLNTLYEWFLFGIFGFYLVVISFDIHSIGENHFRMYGYKPGIFIFVDEISRIIKKEFIVWIKNKFKSKPPTK